MTATLLTGPFDTVTGLPVHPLVVHAAVVLLPLSAIGLVLAILVPRLRSRLAGLSVLGAAAGAVTAWIAEESGEALADRVGVAEAHEEYGELLPALAAVLLVAGAAWWWIQRGAGGRTLPGWAASAAAVLTGVGAAATVVLTVLVGHSGAASVWQEDIVPAAAGATTGGAAPATAATPGATSTPTPGGTAKSGYTLTDVARHNTQQDCWSVVDGTVYDLTAWVAQHPGGPGTIRGMCGVDATAAFRGQHGTTAGPAGALARFRLGPVAPDGASGPAPAAGSAGSASAPAAAPAPEPTTAYSGAEVARHATRTSCWSTLDGKVFDLTQWVSRHPGGAEGILEMCGGPGGEFLEQHAGDAAAEGTLAGYQIGVLR